MNTREGGFYSVTEAWCAFWSRHVECWEALDRRGGDVIVTWFRKMEDRCDDNGGRKRRIWLRGHMWLWSVEAGFLEHWIDL